MGLSSIIIYGFKKIMQYKDKRVALSKDVIEGMKSIKYLGWEQVFDKKIHVARAAEFFYIKLIRIGNCTTTTFWNCI